MQVVLRLQDLLCVEVVLLAAKADVACFGVELTLGVDLTHKLMYVPCTYVEVLMNLLILLGDVHHQVVQVVKVGTGVVLQCLVFALLEN